MENKMGFKEFFAGIGEGLWKVVSTLCIGVWQVLCWFCKVFDPKYKTRFWRVVCSVIAVCLVIIAGILIYAYWWEILRASGRRDQTVWVSDNVYWQKKPGCGNYFFNIKTQEKTLKDVDFCALPFGKDSLGVFHKDGKHGYFNINTGEKAIEALYEKAWQFSEGLAVVVYADSFRVINEKGKFLSSLYYPRKIQEQEGVDHIFHNGLCVMNTKEEKLGLIDKNGKWVIPAEYDCFEFVDRGEASYYKVMMKEPRYGTEIYGVVDMDGNIIGDKALLKELEDVE